MSLTHSSIAAFVIFAAALFVVLGLGHTEAMNNCTASYDVCAYSLR